MVTSSRKTALTALSEVTENEGYSNIVIDKAIRAAELSPRDAALASTIFYGVLEKRLTLDFYIRKFLAKPKQKRIAMMRGMLSPSMQGVIPARQNKAIEKRVKALFSKCLSICS